VKFLKKVHPAAKFFISLSLILPLFFSDNLFPPIFYIIFSTLLMLFFDTICVKRLALIFFFFLPFSVSIFLLNALYGKYTTSPELLLFGRFHLYKQNLIRGIALGTRAYALGVISVSWVLLIDFTRMIKGFMQSFHLNPKIAYALFTGINAIPTIKDEYQRVRQVKRLRGIRRPMILALLINILAQSVRYAERASLAMTARALGIIRTFYTDERVLTRDFIFVGIFYGINFVFVGLFSYLGLYHFGINQVIFL